MFGRNDIGHCFCFSKKIFRFIAKKITNYFAIIAKMIIFANEKLLQPQQRYNIPLENANKKRPLSRSMDVTC